MRKIIFFGIGKLFQANIKNIDFSEVLCFVDNDPALQNTIKNGKMIIKPKRISEFEYDYIVLFNKNQREAIANQLIQECGADPKKIIGWQHYLYVMKYGVDALSLELEEEIIRHLELLNIKKALDFNNGIARNQFANIQKRDISIESVKTLSEEKTTIGYHKSKVYEEILAEKNCYDTVFALDQFLFMDVDSFVEKIKNITKRINYIILTLPYSWPEESSEWFNYDFSCLGKCKYIDTSIVRLLVIEVKKEYKRQDLRLYVVTHKAFTPIVKKGYLSIFAGKTSENDLRIQGDSEGDNIGHLNLKINEATSLYWMWKNVSCDYIGLAHYRRYMMEDVLWIGKDRYLDLEKAADRLGEREMLVASRCVTYPNTVFEHLRISIHSEAFEFAFYSIRKKIEERSPSYLKTFDDYFAGYSFYPCNMFFSKKALVDEYCEWLFDIVIDVAEQFECEKYDNYSKRAVGFMIERLFSVWIIKNEIKVYEKTIGTGEIE